MISPACLLANSAIQWLCRKEYRRFLRTTDIRGAQEARLRAILHDNRDTLAGRRHGFASLRGYEDFARRVPLSDYSDYREAVEAMAAGKRNVLTAEEVRVFEPTSGSTHARKLIPCTDGLKREFQSGLRPWLYDLYRHAGIKGGTSYWSVTPAAARGERTPGGIPIGFEEDGDYFGRWEKRLLARVFAVDPSVARAADMEEFRRRTCAGLLRNSRSLSLVSVWNPAFLLVLLEWMREHRDSLLAALPHRQTARLAPLLAAERYDAVFPRLRLISCWADAQAAAPARRLQALFPRAVVQPKGLLATECFVSFPLLGEDGARLSVHSHFFEFRDVQNGELRLADELRRDADYEIIVTTSGGLYRYRMGDIVRVLSAEAGRSPALRFLGRGDLACDLRGEKLDDAFVARALADLAPRASFALLAPQDDGYVLYVQGGERPAAEDVDRRLRFSYHYDYCRRLGQLRAARVFTVHGGAEKAYLDRLTAQGRRLGDIKPAALSSQDGWDRIFQGAYQG